MNDHQKHIAQTCKHGAENNTMAFPESVKQLTEAGFDRYFVDFCRATVTYYLPTGAPVIFDFSCGETAIPETFAVEAIKDAIRAAQTKEENYTYQWFCQTVMEAGCIGYLVSFTGKRVLYVGRTGDTHGEYFP